MPDNHTTNHTTHQDRIRGNPHLTGRVVQPPKNGQDGGEGSCPAFGYLRGIHDRAHAVEFRLRTGNSVWFPYAWLGNWKYDPSEGLLLKFSGDLVYLVVIRGSNLDRPLDDGSVDLLRAGFQRHRVLWVREMEPGEIETAGGAGPTIDAIEIAEFESHQALTEWLTQTAPAFCR
jgi:hypothetical protein